MRREPRSLSQLFLTYKKVGWTVALLLAVLAPFAIAIPYEQSLLVTMAIYSVAAVGLSIVMGQMGQFSFAHAAFYGVGAYVSGHLALRTGLSPWLGLPLGFLIAGLLGAIVGVIALRRTRGMELAIITLGFGVIVWILVLKWTAVGGGLSGISGVPPLQIGAFALLTPRSYYYVALGCLVLAIFVTVRLTRSSGGRAVIATRENEALAKSIGVSPTPPFVLAFGLGAAWAGLAGALVAHDVRFLNPSLLNLSTMLAFLMMVLIGGTGRVWGPVLGTVLFVWAGEFLRIREDLRSLLFGAVVLVVVRFIPDGAVEIVEKIGGRASRVWQRLGFGARRAGRSERSGNEFGQTVPHLSEPSPARAVMGSSDLPKTSHPTALRIRGLTKRFGGLLALGDVDLDIPEGEIYGLIGPNGSGKTTALNVISGFLRPTDGHVEYRGRSIDSLRPFEIARLGVVRTFQLTNLFANLTVLENVIYGCHLQTRPLIVSSVFNGQAFRTQERSVNERALRILQFVGLEHRSTDVAASLSGGEQRFLGFAIGLASHPSVLLLDEPAAGLNPREAERLGELILELRAVGMTVLVVEHNMKLIADICTRVSVLNFGRVITSGAPEEVASDEHVVEAYLGRRWRTVHG
jgi:branched-chain amino acid transport system permease protein